MSSYDIEDRRTDTVILWYNKHDLPWEHSFCGEPVVPGGHWHTYTVDPALSIAWQPAPLPQPFVRQSEGNFFISPGLKKRNVVNFFAFYFEFFVSLKWQCHPASDLTLHVWISRGIFGRAIAFGVLIVQRLTERVFSAHDTFARVRSL